MAASDAADHSRRQGENATHVNLMLGAGIAALGLLQYILLPLLLLPMGKAWALLLLPTVLMTATHWGLIHEAIHGGFHPAPHINARAGRGLSILFGVPFGLLRFGHLIHHALNRTESDRTEAYDPERTHPLLARLGYYFWLSGGFYLAEMASGLTLLLPRPVIEGVLRRLYPDDVGLRRTARRQLLAHRILREIRLDTGLAILLLALAFVCYGEAWPLLLAALATRGFLVSVLDNLYHYGTPLADVQSALNLRLPTPPWRASF